MIEAKARIIRFWFIAIAVAALGFWEPAMWFGIVPLFFWPNCPCCAGFDCGTLEGQCNTGTAPATMTIDISGVSGTCAGGAACSALDGVYVAAFVTQLSSGCRYEHDLATDVCDGDANEFISVFGFILKKPATVQAIIRVSAISRDGGGSTASMTWDSPDLGAFPIDCSAIGSATCSPSSDSHANCNNAGSTADVTL